MERAAVTLGVNEPSRCAMRGVGCSSGAGSCVAGHRGASPFLVALRGTCMAHLGCDSRHRSRHRHNQGGPSKGSNHRTLHGVSFQQWVLVGLVPGTARVNVPVIVFVPRVKRTGSDDPAPVITPHGPAPGTMLKRIPRQHQRQVQGLEAHRTGLVTTRCRTWLARYTELQRRHRYAA